MLDLEFDLEGDVIGVEKILEVMELFYKDELYVKGDILYVLNEEDEEDEEEEK